MMSGLNDMKRSTALRPGFRKHKRTFREIESRKLIAASQLCSGSAPMQPAGNHQMKHEPEITFHANRNAFPDAPQLVHAAAFNTRDRRIDRPQQKRTRDPHTLQRLAENA